jgi:UDP-N-acetylglucosamine 1-carboxyvinyltransferase
VKESVLKNAECCACDLRGGATLCLAALCSRGVSRVYDEGHIVRGYEKFEENIRSLGGKIKKVYEEEKSTEGVG